VEEKQQLVIAYNPVNRNIREKELWLFCKPRDFQLNIKCLLWKSKTSDIVYKNFKESPLLQKGWATSASRMSSAGINFAPNISEQLSASHSTVARSHRTKKAQTVKISYGRTISSWIPPHAEHAKTWQSSQVPRLQPD